MSPLASNNNSHRRQPHPRAARSGSANDHLPHRRTEHLDDADVTVVGPRHQAAHGRNLKKLQAIFHQVPSSGKPESVPVSEDTGTPRVHHALPLPHTLPHPLAVAVGRVKPYLPLVATYVAMALVFACLVVYVVRNPPAYDITVNGTPMRVFHGTTIQTLLDDGTVSPTPGNFVAVDGSVIEQGKGEPFLATVDGTQTTDARTGIAPGAVVQVDNGTDITEDYDETTEEIPFGTSSQAATRESYFYGAFHIYSQGANGEQATRTGKVSGTSVTLTTRDPIAAGYGVYDADVGDEKVIALTFDDGPWDTTPELLDVLKENDVHATFFTVGVQVSKYPDTVKREYDEGHQVCTHTWDHAAGSGKGVDLTLMTPQEQVSEVEQGFQAIDDVVGTQVTRVFRAPGGNYYGSAVSNLEGSVVAEVGWDVDTRDWSRPGVDDIVDALENVQPGQVVLMHDGGGDRSQTIEALRTALPYLKQQGYRFVTIDELMQTGSGLMAKTTY